MSHCPSQHQVSDFGLSSVGSTHFRSQVSNPIWLAPEILREEPHSTKADVYSFGIIAFEVATRRDYFWGSISFMSELMAKVRLELSIQPIHNV